jgi:Tol biopolymer transport system component
MDLPTGVPHQVTHERHDVSELSWSPDGRRILYSMSIQGPRMQ